jgi:hypothetical protein
VVSRLARFLRYSPLQNNRARPLFGGGGKLLLRMVVWVFSLARSLRYPPPEVVCTYKQYERTNSKSNLLSGPAHQPWAEVVRAYKSEGGTCIEFRNMYIRTLDLGPPAEPWTVGIFTEIAEI